MPTGLPARSIVSQRWDRHVTPFVGFIQRPSRVHGQLVPGSLPGSGHRLSGFSLPSRQINKTVLDALMRRRLILAWRQGLSMPPTFVAVGLFDLGLLQLEIETVPTSADLSSSGTSVAVNYHNLLSRTRLTAT
jgi:hypothetical protein